MSGGIQFITIFYRENDAQPRSTMGELEFFPFFPQHFLVRWIPCDHRVTAVFSCLEVRGEHRPAQPPAGIHGVSDSPRYQIFFL